MLKLTYGPVSDPYRTVTLMGDVRGIFDLWFRLEADKDLTVRVTNLDGHAVDPSEGHGINAFYTCATVFSSNMGF